MLRRTARPWLLYTLTLLFGIGIAFGLSAVAGLLSPLLRLPVFLTACAWWIWNGWKHASARRLN